MVGGDDDPVALLEPAAAVERAHHQGGCAFVVGVQHPVVVFVVLLIFVARAVVLGSLFVLGFLFARLGFFFRKLFGQRAPVDGRVFLFLRPFGRGLGGRLIGGRRCVRIRVF